MNREDGMISIIKTPSPDIKQLQYKSENRKGNKKQFRKLVQEIVEYIFPKSTTITIILRRDHDFSFPYPFSQPPITILFG
jgi:hypothetical protein